MNGCQEYHDCDLDSVDARRYLRQASHPAWPQMKETLWTLATRHLKPADWKKLALHWNFTPDHVRCIEHQYTGKIDFTIEKICLLLSQC